MTIKMLICPLCNENFSSMWYFSRHARKTHDMSLHKLYQDHICDQDNRTCVICDSERAWDQNKFEFKRTCSKKCSMVLSRKMLREDNERMKVFTSKVSSNMVKEWRQRENDGSKTLIIKKAKDTNSTNIASLSKEDRRERFGWLNNLSGSDRHEKIDDIMDKSINKFWRDASDEDKEKIYLQRGISNRKHDVDISVYNDYKLAVRYISNKNCIRYKNVIENIHLRSRNYHLDHKVSIIDCFNNSVPVELAGHYKNLRIVSQEDNLKKGCRSCMTIEELYEITSNDY